MTPTRLFALLLTCLALAFAGCGGDDEEGGGDSGGGSGGASAPAATTDAVSMKSIQFQPKDITVKKGATVTWTNDDSANHDVTKEAGPGPKFSSGTGNLAKGDTYKQTFNTPGKIEYVCKVHPGMDGSVTVK